MVHLLKRLSFTYSKTKFVPGKANKGEKNEILFMDGIHPQHNPTASYAWILKGQEKKVRANTVCKRINLNGAVNIMACLWKFHKKEIPYKTYYESFAKFKRTSINVFENLTRVGIYLIYF